MKIIDSDNYAEAGIETIFFPGGEPHVKVPTFDENLLFFGKLRTWNDVGFAALVMDAITRQAKSIHKVAFIPYWPGARQDRSDSHTPVTVDVMCNLLGRNNFRKAVFDPHSAVTTANPCISAWFMPHELLDIETKDDVVGIIAPDKGAVERATVFRDKFYPSASLITAEKARDFATGKLSSYVMQPLPVVGRYVIVDDICDGGGTFNLLVDAFDRDPIAADCKLEMFVSHGIFSKSIHAISPRIEHITTTDSWCTFAGIYPERLTVLPLLPQIINKVMQD